MFNTLMTSAFRSHKPLKKSKCSSTFGNKENRTSNAFQILLFIYCGYLEDGSEEYLFELRSCDPFPLTVTFEHPCTPSMASSK